MNLEQAMSEIRRLRELLDANGIEWRHKEAALQQPAANLTPEEKIVLFRSIFKGREDVFAQRWFSRTSGKSGYQPVCRKEWNRDFCDKKKYKCANCPNQEFEQLGYDYIYRHLVGNDPDGKDVIGLYAITCNNGCYFLCADFDDKNCEHGYKDDVKAYVSVCRDWGIPAYVERSRSGNGAHVWIFFQEEVKARDVRSLGNAILTEAMEREGRMSFKSYDRFFPNQDILPDGGFGNLVALPLQGQSRRSGNSIFLDDDFNPIADQWTYLQEFKKVTIKQLSDAIAAHCDQPLLGELSKTSDDEPWEKPRAKVMDKSHFPKAIQLTLANGIYVPLEGLSSKPINYLKRIAAFKNPEFFAKQGMRLPTYNIPRIISCAEMTDDYLIMPRGCEDSVIDFLKLNGIATTLVDKRTVGEPIEVAFKGNLRAEQTDAVKSLLAHSNGTLHATTAFGKTVAGIAIIADRKVNTLILVHTKALLDQWRERLESFLDFDMIKPEQQKGRGRKKRIKKFGAVSSTENSLNGKIDVALIQSCLDEEDGVKPFVKDYGMVIVDECHHISAVNYEQVLRAVNARYVYGLTATPKRKDGHHPIIFMQCGAIRYISDAKQQLETQTFQRILVPRFTLYRDISDEKKNFSCIVAKIAEDEVRNQLIIGDIKSVMDEGRTPLVLSNRTAHIDILTESCRPFCKNIIRLVGSESDKSKRETMERLKTIPSDEPLIVIATGKYIGEGFDLPRLDTLFLTLPNSWEGLIAQYAGRLHRDYADKEDVRIYDYVDLRVPVCESMYRKRLSAYKKQGYGISEQSEGIFAEPVTKSIFDKDNFESTFHADLTNALHSVLISCPRLKWRHRPRLIDLLQNKLSKGASVTISVRQTGFNEEELSSIGIRIIQGPTLNCTVIDGKLGWYGSINFAGRSMTDSTAIRLHDSEFCSTLTDNILKGAEVLE